MKKQNRIPAAKDSGEPSERVQEYGTKPEHLGRLARPDAYARIKGPCGDTDEIFLRVRIGKVEKATFMTDGCLFSRAACNAAAHLAVGKALHECLVIDQGAIINHLGGLPSSHAHCALLASKTLSEAVKNYVLDHTRTANRNTKTLKRSPKAGFATSGPCSRKEKKGPLTDIL